MADESNFVVLAFEDRDGADNFLANIDTWEEQGLFQVVDTVITAARLPISRSSRRSAPDASMQAGAPVLVC